MTVDEIIPRIEVDLLNAVKERSPDMSKALLADIRDHLSGRPLSTRPTWFNVRQQPWVRRRAQIREALSRFRRSFMVKTKGGSFFPYGYSQLKAYYTGQGLSLAGPTDYRLTGEFKRSLIVRHRLTNGGYTVTWWLAFRRQARSYGRLTNRELAETLVQRERNPRLFVPPTARDRVAQFLSEIVP